MSFGGIVDLPFMTRCPVLHLLTALQLRPQPAWLRVLPILGTLAGNNKRCMAPTQGTMDSWGSEHYHWLANQSVNNLILRGSSKKTFSWWHSFFAECDVTARKIVTSIYCPSVWSAAQQRTDCRGKILFVIIFLQELKNVTFKAKNQNESDYRFWTKNRHKP